ncbi:hypothetical protein [Thiocapsa rosea]|uniref:hypothetical protein n=1 Tax=Thiocapsa rosea TaxID=69360 RepID=UPI001B885703|nr:hypothetical protein [Thiocapsa rosea]
MGRLKQQIPVYEKGAGSAFAITCDRLDIATQRANALATRFNAKTDPEPNTAIVDLVTLLTSLRGVSSPSSSTTTKHATSAEGVGISRLKRPS